jgi:O-antigen/teichoic acid export membrane protein
MRIPLFGEITLTDTLKKSFTLYSTMVIGMVAGIIISVINTRSMGKEQYGDFKFLINFFSLVVSFLTFGSFYSGGRLLVKTNDPLKKRTLINDVFIMASVSTFILIVASLIFSFFVKSWFGYNLGGLIRISLPLLFIFPFNLCMEQVLQGTNRIYGLSILRLGPRLVFIAISLVMMYFFSLQLTATLFVHLISSAVIIIWIIFILKPKFNYKLIHFEEIKAENRAYGFPVYLGAITGVASSYLAGLTISYYIDNVNVGFFYLAITASMPLAMLPASLGTTFFKNFFTLNKIPRKVNIATFSIGFACLALFMLFIDKLVVLLYTKDFYPVIKISYWIAVGTAFHGFGDFYNKFLSAKGLGKQLRDSNFILGAFNLIGYTVVIKYFGLAGAVYTKLFAGILYFGIMLFYYKRYQKQNS